MTAALVRICLIVAGMLTGGWGAYNCYASWGQIGLSTVSDEIMAGTAFKPNDLGTLEPRLERVTGDAASKPALLRSVAIIRVRQAETELARGRTIAGNPVFATAQAAVRTALYAAPTDSFLWFALCWLKKTENGFDPSLIPLFQLSYDTGEHEGWIATHRNALAVTVLPSLPPSLQRRVVDEFRNLITSNYVPVAADILVGPGWAQRDVLLAGLTAAPERDRGNLARVLAMKGSKIEVPGVIKAPSRPWR